MPVKVLKHWKRMKKNSLNREMKTKEQIHKYNKEYSSRPKVIAWAKVRNARPERRAVRKAYKQTPAAKRANYKYRTKPEVKDRVKKRRLELRYGITHEKFLELKELQQNMCAICRKKTELHIDHCHETGKVRGLLCGPCNRALGLLKDNIDFLLKAIEYLKKS